MKRDKTRPGRKWRFNEAVATAFGDMLKRSIPQIEIMREACFEVGRRYVLPQTLVVDLGCSRGDALAPFVKAFPESRFLGVESSKPMARVAEERFKGNRNVGISPDDVRTVAFRGQDATLILSVLTLQFVPINARQEILREAYLGLRKGGALILVEKVLGNSFEIDAQMVAVYHDMKARNGYSREEIERKRLSLEGVLVPLTASWNEDLLRTAGFDKVDVFWRWMNFSGWVAVK